jgi:probable rRNA maturation factor
VTVTDGAGRPLADGGLAGWLTSIAPRRARGDVGVALVSDARMRALNHRYRRQNRPTDVLSFAANGASEERGTLVPRQRHAEGSPLGDIVIATGVARRQAREAGHSLQSELRVLALHGLLHLLGYDHHGSDDAGRMRRLEARLRRKGGLGSSLIERAAARPAGRRARA